MRTHTLTIKTLRLLLIALLLAPSGLTKIAQAQPPIRGNSSAILPAGTAVSVRTSEDIEADESDGRVFRGVVEDSIVDRNGNVLIPRGSDVGLIVRNISDDELSVDLQAITVNGRRYGIESESDTVTVAGAVAGAGAQVLTRGHEVQIPAETLLTFRLPEPMRTSTVYGATTSSAYQAGLEDGCADGCSDFPFDTNSYRWRSSQEWQDYQAGYLRAYTEGYPYDNSPRYGRATIDIGCDNRVTWLAPGPSFVSVQVDSDRPRLFAEGQSGARYASLSPGHVYVFTVEDLNGNELARDRLDLR